MNERLIAYKKRKAKESKMAELNRRYPDGIPPDYRDTNQELKREFRRIVEGEK